MENPFYHFRHFNRASDGAEVATKSDNLTRYEPHPTEPGTLLTFEHGGNTTVWHVTADFAEVKHWATGAERFEKVFGKREPETADD